MKRCRRIYISIVAISYFIVGEAQSGPCDKISSLSVIEKCYGDVAAQKNDLSICDKYKTQGLCHARFAIAKNDPSICEKLTFSARNFCYFDVAQTLKNLKLCDLIDSADTKNFCYASVE